MGLSYKGVWWAERRVAGTNGKGEWYGRNMELETVGGFNGYCPSGGEMTDAQMWRTNHGDHGAETTEAVVDGMGSNLSTWWQYTF